MDVFLYISILPEAKVPRVADSGSGPGAPGPLPLGGLQTWMVYAVCDNASSAKPVNHIVYTQHGIQESAEYYSVLSTYKNGKRTILDH